MPPKFDLFRAAQVFLLAYIAMLLMDYAPLVPRAVTFMEDVHYMREKSKGWEEKVEEIQKSLGGITKLISYFQAEAERQGRPWPKQ